MIDRRIIDWMESDQVTQEDIFYLLNKLCLVGMKSSTTTKAKVRLFLKSRLGLDRVSRSEVAGFLNMSTRTLSRKLKNEQTGFHKLLDEERQRRCQCYMQGNIICGQELTELLGLSDISHFYRCFKQWTGQGFSESKSKLAKNNSKIDTIFHRQTEDRHR